MSYKSLDPKNDLQLSSESDISTNICGIFMDSSIMNASGCRCSSVQELDLLEASASGAILSKSSTIVPNKGNVGVNGDCACLFLDDKGGSINSMGLPNPGYQFYINYNSKRQSSKKPFIYSIYPRTPEDMETMLYDIDISTTRPTLVEINISCPNTGRDVYIFSNIKTYVDHLNHLASGGRNSSSRMVNNVIPGLKLPPFYEPYHFDIMASMLSGSAVKFITCINSIPNGLIIDPYKRETRISPNSGMGGIGGAAIKSIALANVYNFNKRLANAIDIIGCGGCFSGMDVYEHLLCGAKAVQVGTCLISEGSSCFDRIGKELKDILRGHRVCDIRGSLTVRAKL